MKFANKRLIISIVALVFAIGLTATTTLAWFSTTNTPSVTGINLDVTSQDGLFISLTGDAASYSTLIAYSADTSAYELKPLTPVLTGSTDGDRTLSSKLQYDNKTQAIASDKAYFEMPIYFRSNSQYIVSLLPATDISSTRGDIPALTAWRNFDSGTLYTAQSTQIIKGNGLGTNGFDLVPAAANAARIGITTHTMAISSGVVNHTVSDSTEEDNFVYSPNAGVGCSADKYLINAAHDYYNTNTKTTANPSGLTPNFTTEGKRLTTTADTYDEYDVYTNGTVTSRHVPTAVSMGTSLELLTLQEVISGSVTWYEGAITIRIWIEGTDANCFEDLLKSAITTNLHFSGTVA